MGGVCLDTNVLVWLMRRPSDDRREVVLSEKARFLVEQLEKSKETIVLPAVVVAEFLTPIGPGERPSALAALEHRFKVVSFDGMAALEFARLPRNPGAGKRKGRVMGAREKHKFDRMVVATALAAKAKAIYSEDDDLHAIGSGLIKVHRLPAPPPAQMSLPVV